jgi:hypothetical protein
MDQPTQDVGAMGSARFAMSQHPPIGMQAPLGSLEQLSADEG